MRIIMKRRASQGWYPNLVPGGMGALSSGTCKAADSNSNSNNNNNTGGYNSSS